MLTELARIGSEVKKSTQNSQWDISCDEAVCEPLNLSLPFVRQAYSDAGFSTCLVVMVEERFSIYMVCRAFQRHCAGECY